MMDQYIQNILNNQLSSEILVRFLNDCSLNDVKLTRNLKSQQLIQNAFKEYVQKQYLQTTTLPPSVLIYKFLTTVIENIDDKNLLRLLQILELIPNQHLAALTSNEFQNFKNELRQYHYNEPEPYSPLTDYADEFFPEPETPIDGLPTTSKLLFVPDGFNTKNFKSFNNSISPICPNTRPSLKIDTTNVPLENSCLSTPVVVLDTSYL